MGSPLPDRIDLEHKIYVLIGRDVIWMIWYDSESVQDGFEII